MDPLSISLNVALSTFVSAVVSFFTNKALNARSVAAQKKKAAEFESPFFVLSERFRHSFGINESLVSVASGNVLCVEYESVKEDLPDNFGVCLLVENRGCTVRRAEFKMDGEPIEFVEESDIEDSLGFSVIVYPYAPQKRGKTQTIEVRFVSATAHQDVHRYETVHGFRLLKRIDPPQF